MLLGLQESSPRMNARRQGSWACRAIDARVPRVLGLGGQVALRGADQALRPALPCRRGPGSGHAAKQPLHTGPPDLRLLTQRTDDRPVSREEASAREGVLPARTSPPHWGVLWGPGPLCGQALAAGGKQHGPSFPLRMALRMPAAHSATPVPPGTPTKGPSSASVPHLSPASQPAGRAHGDLSSRLWRGQASGTPAGRARLPRP